MKIYGFEKVSMVDFDGHLCATVFTGGCNFRCPFCQNSDLVEIKNLHPVSEEEFFDHLEKRKTLLDSVCISGGEPSLQPDLIDFLKKIKKKGFLIKFDTNGTNCELLKELVKQKLVDYVAMDIKNSKSMYEKTAGAKVDLKEIEKSIDFLKSGVVPYEFRTTIVRGHHTDETIKEMAKWLSGSKKLFLQHFKDNGSCIQPGLKDVSKEDALRFKSILEKTIEEVGFRGY